MTSEAFQLIIHAQVKALIMLGAPVQLEVIGLNSANNVINVWLILLVL